MSTAKANISIVSPFNITFLHIYHPTFDQSFPVNSKSGTTPLSSNISNRVKCFFVPRFRTTKQTLGQYRLVNDSTSITLRQSYIHLTQPPTHTLGTLHFGASGHCHHFANLITFFGKDKAVASFYRLPRLPVDGLEFNRRGRLVDL